MQQVHSSLEAAIFVCGSLAIVGGPILWWIFFRMDEGKTYDQPTGEIDASPMTTGEIRRVESELAMSFPPTLSAFLLKPRDIDVVDFETLAGSAEGFIEMTTEYRAGFEGAPPWPKHWIFIGDDGTACPYALDCLSGEIAHLDHGDPRRKLSSWRSFEEFLKQQERESKEVEDTFTSSNAETGDWIPSWMYTWRGAVACTGALLCVAAIFIFVARMLGGI